MASERPTDTSTSARQLTADLCKALGLPPMTTRAVLTLETGQLPRLHVECFCIDKRGRPLIEERPGEYGEPAAKRVAKVRFILRLEPSTS